jgi:hypothetical protein
LKKSISIKGSTLTLLKNGEVSTFSGIYLDKDGKTIPVGTNSVNIQRIGDCRFVRVEGVIPEKIIEQTMKKTKDEKESDTPVSPYLKTVFSIDYSPNPTRPKLVMATPQETSKIGLMRLTLIKDGLSKHSGDTHKLHACSTDHETNEFLFAIRSGEKAKYNFLSGSNLEIEYTGKEFNCVMNF